MTNRSYNPSTGQEPDPPAVPAIQVTVPAQKPNSPANPAMQGILHHPSTFSLNVFLQLRKSTFEYPIRLFPNPPSPEHISVEYGECSASEHPGCILKGSSNHGIFSADQSRRHRSSVFALYKSTKLLLLSLNRQATLEQFFWVSAVYS